MTPAEAYKALERAESTLADAERGRAQAADAFDSALAQEGWRRLTGTFSPTATPIYTSRLYPQAHLHAAEVLEILAERNAA